jgi:hypothetical protein
MLGDYAVMEEKAMARYGQTRRIGRLDSRSVGDRNRSPIAGGVLACYRFESLFGESGARQSSV